MHKGYAIFSCKYGVNVEAAELFAAARENAKWRYRSYLRMHQH